jgi:hypothetical protein
MPEPKKGIALLMLGKPRMKSDDSQSEDAEDIGLEGAKNLLQAIKGDDPVGVLDALTQIREAD